MSARRACCRYTNRDLDKGLVPNKPCQPNAYPSGYREGASQTVPHAENPIQREN